LNFLIITVSRKLLAWHRTRHCTGANVDRLLYWDEFDERQLLGPELVQETKEKIALIGKCMLTAQSQQKSYANKHRRELEFAIGDLVYLKVSPMQNLYRFGNKGKLSPRYVGQFQVLKRVSPLAYKIKMPHNLASVHDVFHVSQLRKCVHDPIQVISQEPLDIQPNLTYEELLVQIFDRKEHQLRTKSIPLVKVYDEITALRKPRGSLSSRCKIDIPICSSEPRYGPLIHTDYVLIHNENECLHVHKADKYPNFEDKTFIRREGCNV
jgi:hypothetical protein